MARVRDPAGFATLAAACQENCVNSHTTHLALRRISALLAAKGGHVADITIGDCLELLQIAGGCCAAAMPPARTSTSCCEPRGSSVRLLRPGGR
jgi:hypothetical protein